MVNRETQCSKHWFGLTRLWILTLEPERLKNRRATACDESREGWGSQQTLKLLVVSDVGRRNALSRNSRFRPRELQ